MPRRFTRVQRPLPFRGGIRKENYSIRETESWEFVEPTENRGVNANNANPLYKKEMPNPHMVLCDNIGTPRFVLGYDTANNVSYLMYIQRERTQYSETEGNAVFWDREKEKEASHSFAKTLNGIHPTEFLFCEFVERETRRGHKVVIREPMGADANNTLGPLIDRFCRKKGEVFSARLYDFMGHALDPEKSKFRKRFGENFKPT
jgi:hypothetical protein